MHTQTWQFNGIQDRTYTHAHALRAGVLCTHMTQTRGRIDLSFLDWDGGYEGVAAAADAAAKLPQNADISQLA